MVNWGEGKVRPDGRMIRRYTIWATLIFLVLIMLIGVSLYLIYRFESTRRLNSLIRRNSEFTDVVRNKVRARLWSVMSDVEYLGSDYHVSVFMTGRQESIMELTKDFQAFSLAKQCYAQIRYLDLDGNEIIRVDYRDGQAVIVPHSQLQNKKGRYYFRETVGLGPRDVYVSPLDLNIEFKKIVVPYEPMIRIGKPIFYQGRRVGVLVVNYWADRVLSVVNQYGYILLNRQGGWLTGGGIEHDWGFMWKGGKNFNTEYPEVWNRIVSDGNGHCMAGNSLYVFNTIRPFRELTGKSDDQSEIDDYQWYLVHRVKEPEKVTGLDLLRLFLSWVWGGAWVIGGWLTVMIARAIYLRRRDDYRFQILFENSTDPHLILHQGVIVKCNRSAVRILGCDSEKDLLYRGINMFFSVFQDNEINSTMLRRQYIMQIENTGQPLQFGWEYRRVGGGVIYVEETLIPVDGNASVLLSVWHDLTERRGYEKEVQRHAECDEIESEVSRRFLEARIDQGGKESIQIISSFLNCEVGAIYLLKDGSDAAVPFWSWTRNGQAWGKRIDIGDRDFAPFLSRMSTEALVIADADGIGDELVLPAALTCDGWMEGVFFPIVCHRHLSGFVLFLNHDKRSWPEETVKLLRRFSESLALALERSEAEAALARAKEAADQANRAKSEFLANMSHEIRTPMNAVLGFTEVLQGMIDDPQAGHYLQAIQSSGKTLLGLINDILDLSKIEAGKLKLEPRALNLREMVRDMEMIFSCRLKEKGLYWRAEIGEDFPAALLLDEVRIRQILLNLIGNAVKFTESGGITVSLRAEYVDAGLRSCDLVFAVTDTGIGIPEEQQKLIFNAFEQRAGQNYHKYGGTGLGLSITLRLVQLMGGHINLRSVSGEGSLFEICLPGISVDGEAAPVLGAETPQMPYPAEVRFKPADVVVIDDVRENCMLISAFLEHSGLRLHSADNGEEGWKMIREIVPALVITDLKMPGLDGATLIARMKRYPEYRDIPVIVLTASVLDSGDISDHVRYDGFIRKPVSRAVLLTELSRFLRRESTDAAVPEVRLPEEADVEAVAVDWKEVLPALHSILDREYREARDTYRIDAAGVLAAKLTEIGQVRHCPELARFAADLNLAVNEFDVVRMQQLLADFPGLVEECKKRGEAAGHEDDQS